MVENKNRLTDIHDDFILFAEEDQVEENTTQDTWKILIVDDEEEIHKVTKMVLSHFEFEGKSLSFISVYSEEEAKKQILENGDIAVILLDVVMEREDSGLMLVKYIRDELKNKLVRIILRTGQPGQAPEEKVILDYDINDYKEKSDLTSKKLFTSIVSALRSYRDLHSIDTSRKGLESIIKSSSSIFRQHSMREFASGVLMQLTSILHLDKDAFYCKALKEMEDESFYIMAGTGAFYPCIDKDVREVLPREGYQRIREAYTTKKSVFHEEFSVIYFETKMGSENIIYVKNLKVLGEWDRYLLEYCCINVSIAFDGIYLNQEVIDNIKEPILVVDKADKVISFNQPLSDMLKKAGIQMSHYNGIDVLVNSLESKFENTPSARNILDAVQKGANEDTKGELTLTYPEKKCYATQIHPIMNSRKEILGRMVTFNDISEYQLLLEELNQRNLELSEAYQKLKEYADTVEELAIEKERTRLARDVHDTLGHSLTLLIAMIEVSIINCKSDPGKTQEKLVEAARLAREGLQELRQSVKGLSLEKLDGGNLIHSLQSLISSFKTTGISIEFLVDGVPNDISISYSNVIYRICQETLTNSLRHGEAKNINIILKFLGHCIKLFVIDDGRGCKKISKGFGLRGMEQRVHGVNGKITYGSDGESGFNIMVEIPISNKQEDVSS